MPLQPGRRSGNLAPIPEEQLRRGGELRGNCFGERQPRSAAGDFGASAFGFEPRVLVRDLRQYADRSGQRAFALQRHSDAEVFRNGKPAGSAAVFHHRRARGGLARRVAPIPSIRRLKLPSGWRITLRLPARPWRARGCRLRLILLRSSGGSKRTCLFRMVWDASLRPSCAAGCCSKSISKTGNAEAGKLALAKYQEARSAWASMADRANRVYQPDITYGNIPMRRGNWSARMAGIDADIAAMEKKLQAPPAGSTQNVASAIQAATGKPNRPSVHCVHTPPSSFHPGQPLSLSLSASGHSEAVHLYYRHVNQGERWVSHGNATQQQWIRRCDSWGLHKFCLPVAVLLCTPAWNRGGLVFSRV